MKNNNRNVFHYTSTHGSKRLCSTWTKIKYNTSQILIKYHALRFNGNHVKSINYEETGKKNMTLYLPAWYQRHLLLCNQTSKKVLSDLCGPAQNAIHKNKKD